MTGQREDIDKLLTSASLVFVGLAVDSVASLVERVVIGRALSPAAYGDVNIGLAVLVLGTTLGQIGLHKGVARYIPRYDDEADVRGVWVSGLVATAVTSTVIAAVLLLNVDLVAGRLFESPRAVELLFLLFLSIPLEALLILGVSAIQGLENTRYMLYVQKLLYPISRIGLIAAFLWAGFDIVAVGYAYLLSLSVALVVAYLLLNRLVPLLGPFRLHLRELVRFSLPLVLSGLLVHLLTRTDTLMLGYFRTSFEVGLYSAAYPLAHAMMIVHAAFGFLFLPVASRLDAEGRREGVDEIFKLTTKWIYVTTFPAFLAFLVFPGDVIAVFFGEEYTAGALALAILSAGFFVRAFNGRNREALAALGNTTYILLGTSTAFVVNVVANLLLIPPFGIEGAAVASAISFVLLNVIITGILWWSFDVSPFSWVGSRAYVLLPVALLPPAYLLSGFLTLTPLTLVPFLVVVGLFTLVVTGLAGSIQPEDAILIEFVEERIDIEIPFVRRFIPTE